MGSKVIHFEITGTDGPKLQGFYSDLFGWKLDTSNPGGYGMTSADETGIVVGVGTAPQGPGFVTGYVRVADIDATLAKAASLGGSTVMPKFSPDGSAQLALVADPDGSAQLALVADPDGSAQLALVADPEGHVIGISE